MTTFRARVPYERCPLCGESGTSEVMLGDCSGHVLYRDALPRFQRWVRCLGCDHVYVDGYFTPEALRILFSDSLPQQTPGYDLENARYVAGRMVESICDRRRELGGRWLDVGFGSGALLTTAAEFGFDVTGLDLRPAVVEAMRDFGFAVQAMEFEDFWSPQPFDVISMMDVLEHMPFPKQALAHAWKLLNGGGHLFLSMPNSDGFLWQFLSRNGQNPYWGEIEHLHNFGRRRLYALLAECGFQPVRYALSYRYRACMEVIATKVAAP